VIKVIASCLLIIYLQKQLKILALIVNPRL